MSSSWRKPSHLKRYAQIADILARQGLGYFSDVFALDRFVPRRKEWRNQLQTDTAPTHLRLALEEMGATAIKLGQILSTRADLLPPEYQAELAILQDSAPPVPSEAILEIVEEELGRPIEEIFDYFEPEPLAAASIGQAHTAILLDGTEVVVKVRRPGVDEQIEQDLEIFEDLALSASRRWAAAEQYDLPGLAREFAETLRTELDYIREGHSAERIAKNFKDNPQVHIPKIFWEATTSRMLTMERIHGLKINDVEGIDAAGIDRKDLAQRAAHAILKMVFEDGYFHADPHPGNVFVEPDGTIAFIDFGMVGTVDEATRNHTVNLLTAISSKDAERLTDAFLDLSVSRQRVDRVALRNDLQQLGDRYMDRTLGEIQLGAFLSDSLAIVRKHKLQLPRSMVLILKMGVMVEGTGALLDPDFNLMHSIRPHGERLLRERYSPANVAKRLGQASLDAVELSTDMPILIKRLLQDLERGNIEIGAHPAGFEPLIDRLEQMVDRIVLGTLTAAFIVGLSVLMQVYHPPGWQDWAGLVFGVGLMIACLMGLYLAYTILRHSRRK